MLEIPGLHDQIIRTPPIAAEAASMPAVLNVNSPVLGWVGVFLAGFVVNNNALFGSLQVVTGTQFDRSPVLLMAANTAGGRWRN